MTKVGEGHKVTGIPDAKMHREVSSKGDAFVVTDFIFLAFLQNLCFLLFNFLTLCLAEEKCRNSDLR